MSVLPFGGVVVYIFYSSVLFIIRGTQSIVVVTLQIHESDKLKSTKSNIPCDKYVLNMA